MKYFVPFFLLTLFSFLAPTAHGQAIFTGSGDWLDALLWDTGVVPPDGSTAIVNGDAQITQNIVSTQNANASRVEIGSGIGETGTLTVSGGTLSGAHGGASGGIYVGVNGGTGTLIVEQGATYRSQGGGMRIVIGDDFGGTGMISVAGVLQNYKILEIVNGTLEMLSTGQNNLFNSNDPSFISANGTLAYVIDGTNVGALKRSNTAGLNLTIDPAANLLITLGGTFSLNDSWVLMSYTTLNGQFTQATSFTNLQGYTFDLDYGSGTNDVVSLTLVSDAQRPKIDALSATPPAISSGQTSTIEWSASNFDTLTLDPGGADVTAAVNFPVMPASTTTYTLSAVLGAVTVTRDVTVVVDELPEINSFGATENVIAPGDSTTLSWIVSGADAVTITPAPGAVNAVDSTSVSPGANTTYTLTATNGTGSVMAELSITVDAIAAAIIHCWDPSGPGQSSGALLDSVGGKNFDMTGGDLLNDLTSPGTSLTTAMSRINLDADTGGDNGLGFSGTERTYEFWVQMGVLDDRFQVLFETGGSSDGSCLLVSSSGVRFMHSVAGANTIDIEAPLTLVDPADFIHIMASVDGNAGHVDLYLRGAAGGVGTASGDGTIGAPNGRASIFTWSGFAGAIAGALGGVGVEVPAETTTFKGTIGMFKIYDRPFSSAEVDDAYLRIGEAIIPIFFDIEARGNELVLTWESIAGMSYNLTSSTDLAVDPSTWDLVEGDIPATPPTNTKVIQRPGDAVRFYRVEEFPLPPVGVFEEHFDGANAGTLPTDWTTGFDPADTLMNTNWELGDPSVTGPLTAFSGAHCVGTNLLANHGLSSNTWLRTPAIDLSTASGATLTFQQWIDMDEFNDLDRGTVRVLDAATLVELAVVEAVITGLGALDWDEFSADLPAEALGKIVLLEFQFVSDGDDIFDASGWYIDDVAVTTPAP
ncbi:MAG: choice-of-anchor J domain-containing protein [Roseibacillus sp.]